MNPSRRPKLPEPSLPFPEAQGVGDPVCNNGSREAKQAADHWNYCPNCGCRLHNHRCKLRCPDPRCGYFMSCSDFD